MYVPVPEFPLACDEKMKDFVDFEFDKDFGNFGRRLTDGSYRYLQ